MGNDIAFSEPNRIQHDSEMMYDKIGAGPTKKLKPPKVCSLLELLDLLFPVQFLAETSRISNRLG